MSPHPANIAVVLAVALVVGAALAAVLAYVFATRGLRRLGWSREQRRRRQLRRAVASVEHFERLTSLGHFDLVLAFASPESAARDGVHDCWLRGAARLPPEVQAHLEATHTLPICFDPAAVARAVLDFEALLGERGERLDREAYVERGSVAWKVLPATRPE